MFKAEQYPERAAHRSSASNRKYGRCGNVEREGKDSPSLDKGLCHDVTKGTFRVYSIVKLTVYHFLMIAKQVTGVLSEKGEK